MVCVRGFTIGWLNFARSTLHVLHGRGNSALRCALSKDAFASGLECAFDDGRGPGGAPVHAVNWLIAPLIAPAGKKARLGVTIHELNIRELVKLAIAAA